MTGPHCRGGILSIFVNPLQFNEAADEPLASLEYVTVFDADQLTEIDNRDLFEN